MIRFTIEFPGEARHPDCWEVSVDALIERIEGEVGEFEYERHDARRIWSQTGTGRMITYQPDESNFLAGVSVSVSHDSDPMLDWVERFCERHNWRLFPHDA